MSAIKPKHFFMEHAQMDFETQILLGCCHYGAADAGEILATVERVPSGDFEQWYQEWFALGERMQAIAERCAASGHRVSARKAFLRAATYFSASAVFIDGTQDPSRGVPAWKRHLRCWELFCSHLNPPAEKVSIPYEFMEEGLRPSGDAVRQNVEGRMKPYLAESYYHLFKKVRQYNARDVIQQIQCPLFIADPDDEQFWSGQSQEVYDALVCPKTIVRFTATGG